ncbi:MAG: hypothetical protein CK533_13465 [Acidobacterium sp.]|nr:MAG: hypothetical protein CK533_13465 [Acidobacterium sp.]
MLPHLGLAVLLAAAHLLAAVPARVLDLNGRPVNPLASGRDRVATVLVFTTTDCPISNRYAPEIQSLAAKFQTQGIGFTLVYPVSTDTPGVIREHVKKFGYALPVVRDTAQELVKHTGVRVTPEVAVIGAGGQVLYRGRIDDRHIDFGKDRPQPTERTLERALEAVRQGQPVAVRETQAVGCFLPDLIR